MRILMKSLRRLAPLVLAAVLAAAVPATADAKRPRLWATVNICDTAAYPDMMGVRASMPGNRTRQRMFMRFRVQWFSREKKRWSNLDDARTDWIYAGSALYRSRQVGWTFPFESPAPNSFLVRGVVDFAWRKKKKRKGKGDVFVTVKDTRRVTSRGHPADGADPPGYSERACEIF